MSRLVRALSRGARGCRWMSHESQGEPAAPLVANEAGQAQSLDRLSFEFLQETRITRMRQFKRRSQEQDTSLWNYLQCYSKEAYREKFLMMDPALARDVAQIIAETTERGPDTTFVDADGGLCQVTQHLLANDVFPRAKIYLKDINLKLLLDRALDTNLAPFREKITWEQHNLVQFSSKHMADPVTYISPLCHEGQAQDWAAQAPAFTLFGTVTHGLIKYLTVRRLTRGNVFSEFHQRRPEFYFIVSPRTLTHMKGSGLRRVSRGKDIQFRLFFDCSVLSELPRSSFFPWLKKASTQIYRHQDDSLFLVRVRPRADVEINPKATSEQFEFFIYSVYHNKNLRVLPLLEKWLPNSGLELIRQGHDIYLTSNDLDEWESLRIFNLLADMEGYDTSMLALQAESYAQTVLADRKIPPKDELKLEELRRKFLPE